MVKAYTRSNPNKYKCGKCGKTGHNSRRCGKTTQKVTATLTPPNHQLQHNTNYSVALQGGTGVEQSWESYNRKTQPVTDAPAEDLYSLEELETLWLLKNGSDGKRAKGKNRHWGENRIWDEQSNANLIDFVHDIENNPPGVSVKTWRRFFKNFGTAAREDFLTAHKIAPRFSARQQRPYDLAFPTPPAPASEPEPKTLPLKMFPVFIKDPSHIVRSELASRSSIPEPVALAMAEDKHMMVLTHLARNGEVSTDVVVKIEHRLSQYEEGKISLKELPYGQRSEAKVREGIASHPNITEELVNKYLNNENIMKHVGVQQELFGGPHISRTAIESYRQNVSHELAEIEKEIRKVQNTPTPVNAGKDYVFKTSMKLSNMKRRERQLSLRLEGMMKAGRCSPEVVGARIENIMDGVNAGNRHKMFWEMNFAEDVIANTNFTPKQLTQYYMFGKKHGELSFLKGTLGNPNTPHGIVEDYLSEETQKLIGVDSDYRYKSVNQIAKHRIKTQQGKQ